VLVFHSDYQPHRAQASVDQHEYARLMMRLEAARPSLRSSFGTDDRLLLRVVDAGEGRGAFLLQDGDRRHYELHDTLSGAVDAYETTVRGRGLLRRPVVWEQTDVLGVPDETGRVFEQWLALRFGAPDLLRRVGLDTGRIAADAGDDLLPRWRYLSADRLLCASYGLQGYTRRTAGGRHGASTVVGSFALLRTVTADGGWTVTDRYAGGIADDDPAKLLTWVLYAVDGL
jgi:hypothetical protein